MRKAFFLLLIATLLLTGCGADEPPEIKSTQVAVNFINKYMSTVTIDGYSERRQFGVGVFDVSGNFTRFVGDYLFEVGKTYRITYRFASDNGDWLEAIEVTRLNGVKL